MRCWICVTAGLLAFLIQAEPTRAQAPEAGTLIRVPAESCTPFTGLRWAEGRLVAVRNDSLFVMNPPRSWACPAALVGRVQVATDQDVEGFSVSKSVLEGTAIGGGVGLAAGVLAGRYFADRYHGGHCSTEACARDGFDLTEQAHLAIGWAGLVFGMLAGAAIDRMGWWDDVPVPAIWPDDPDPSSAGSPSEGPTPLVRARARGDGVEVGFRVTLPAAERHD